MRNFSIGIILATLAAGWVNPVFAVSFPKSCPTVERIHSIYTAHPGKITCYSSNTCVYDVENPIFEGTQLSPSWGYLYHSWHFYLVLAATSTADAKAKAQTALESLVLQSSAPSLKLQMANVWQCHYGTSTDAIGTTSW